MAYDWDCPWCGNDPEDCYCTDEDMKEEPEVEADK